MDTDLVVRSQRGDKEAYAVLATEIADRFLAVARRILRDMDLAVDIDDPHPVRSGTLIWIDAYTFKGAGPEPGQEIQQIIDSIQFE